MFTTSCRVVLVAVCLLFLAACTEEDVSLQDNQNLIDNEIIENAVLWSDADTWGGSIPESGSEVVITSDMRVILDMDIDVQSLQVDGVLRCADQDLQIRTESIVIHGLFECGTEEKPFLNELVVTLVGDESDESIMGMGTKLIGVMNQGVLELHGMPRMSWVRLNEMAEAGDQQIVLDEATDWQPGDIIVIASTDYDMNQAEKRVITGVDGNVITFDEPLAYMHFGELQHYPNDNVSGVTVLDQRAEVGLLNRNILIRGDESSQVSGFGGHMMSMDGAEMRISSVQFDHMGQLGQLARYPVHWHLVGDANGQYIRNSTINYSFNRCITIHGTHNLLLEDNICYDHIGHGFFMEDGIETGNVFDGNLGLLTRRPDEDKAILSTDIDRDNLGPATYWITNPDNVYRNNVAAGSDGSGFWLSPFYHPIGASLQQNIAPYQVPFREFVNNVAHSSIGSGLLLAFGREHGPDDYNPSEVSVFENFTAYKISGRTGGQSGAVWSRGINQVFKNFVVADMRHGYNFTFDQILENGLIVGESRNIGHPTHSNEIKAGRSLPWPEHAGLIRTGYGFYDGPHHLINVHFAGYTDNTPGIGPWAAFSSQTGAYKAHNHLVEGVTFEANTVKFYFECAPESSIFQRESVCFQGVIDLDGSMSGYAGHRIIAGSPLMMDDSCIAIEDSQLLPAWACTGTTGEIWLRTLFPTETLEWPARVTRDDGATQLSHGLIPGEGIHWHQINALTNRMYEYEYDIAQMPRAMDVQLIMAELNEWVLLTLPVREDRGVVVSLRGIALEAEDGLEQLHEVDRGYFIRDGKLYIKLTADKEMDKYDAYQDSLRVRL